MAFIPQQSPDSDTFLKAMEMLTTTISKSIGTMSSKLDIMADLQSKIQQCIISQPPGGNSWTGSQNSSVGSERSSSMYSPSLSRSPSPPRRRYKRTRDASTHSDSYFIEHGYTWLWITRDTDMQGSKVRTAEGMIPYILHDRKRAYRTVARQHETETPYMGPQQALDAMVSYLSTQRDSGDKIGPNNRSFRWHLEESSDLSSILRVLVKHSPTAVDAIFRNDTKALETTLPSSAFDAVSVVNFTSGWNFTKNKDFSKFANSDILNMRTVSRRLEVTDTIIVPQNLLKEEKTTRTRLVEYISGIGMFDCIIGKIDSTSPLHEALKAATRHSVSFLKDYTEAWYKAKFAVRRAALQYTAKPISMKLLCSNMWEASLFGSDAVTDFINRDVRQEGTMNRLGLKPYNKNGRTNSTHKPTRKRSRSRSRSPKRRSWYTPHRQHNNQGQRPDSFPSSERYNQSSQPGRGGSKKQKVSFQDQRQTSNQSHAPRGAGATRGSGSTRGRGRGGRFNSQ